MTSKEAYILKSIRERAMTFNELISYYCYADIRIGHLDHLNTFSYRISVSNNFEERIIHGKERRLTETAIRDLDKRLDIFVEDHTTFRTLQELADTLLKEKPYISAYLMKRMTEA